MKVVRSTTIPLKPTKYVAIYGVKYIVNYLGVA